MRLFLLLLMSSCATTVSVEPGHGAVILTPDGTLSVLAEGSTDVPAGTVVDDFNLRQLELHGSFQAVTTDGVPVVVGDPVVSYRVLPAELVAADRAIGTANWDQLIGPIVQSTVANVLSTYRFTDLDTDHMRAVQATVTTRAAAALRAYHLEVLSVDLKGVFSRLPGLAQSVTGTSVWEQRSLTAASRIEVARQRADALRNRAQGIAAANKSLAPTLSKEVLVDKLDQAWQRLVTSPRTTVQLSNELEVSP